MRRLHIGADAAEPQQIGRRLQDRGDQRGGIEGFVRNIQHGADRGRQRDRLLRPREYAAAGRDQAGVIVRPGRARQPEQARPFGPAGGRIGIRIEEDMAMIERRHQFQRLRQQHPVAEHIARHVAAADHADRIGLHVHAPFGEMPLDRDPGALGGDTHRLVVIPLRPARGERIAQPETAFDGDRVGDVGEGGGALVGGDDEIGIVLVADRDGVRMHHRAVDDIVGDRQQRADEDAVAFGAFGQPRIAIAGGRQRLRIEAALRAGGHDHRVLHHLCLHQPQDFGAEIVAPVGPAQAPARDRPAAQVDALDPRRIDPDLAPRHGRGQAGDQPAVQLERQRLVGRGGKGVGAQRRLDHAAQAAQDAVVVDRGHRGERGIDRGIRGGGIAGARRIVQRIEQRDQPGGGIGRTLQRLHHGGEPIGHPRLAEIAEPGAQQHDRARGKADRDDQRVELVIFRTPLEHRGDRRFGHLCVARDPFGDRARSDIEQEIVDIARAPLVQRGGGFAQHAEAEVFEHGHRIGQRDHPADPVCLQVQRAGYLVRTAADPRAACLRAGQRRHPQDVDRAFGRIGAVPVTGREGIGIGDRQTRGAAGALAGHQARLDRRRPAAQHRLQLGIKRIGIDAAIAVAGRKGEPEQRQIAIVQIERPVDRFRSDRLPDHRRHAQPALRGQLVARQPDEGDDVAAQRRGDEHQLGPRPIRQRHGGERDPFERRSVEPGQQIMRQRGQRVAQRLAGMAAGIEPVFLLQRPQPRAQHRHAIGRCPQRRAGPQADMDRQRRHPPFGPHRHHDQIERRAAMDGGDAVRFQDQRRFAAPLEMRHRPVAIGVAPQGARRHRQDADRVPGRPVQRLGLRAQQREMPIEQPAQQCGALAVGHAFGLVAQRDLQPRPVLHRGPDIGQHRADLVLDPAAIARIGAFDLHVHDRFAAFAGRAGGQDRIEQPVRVTADRHDRMQQPVDGQTARGHRARDRIDQERHVGIDRHQPHPPAARIRSGRFDPHHRLARRAARGDLGDEGGGRQAGGGIESIGLARQRAGGERGGDCIALAVRGGRFSRLGGHGCPLLGCQAGVAA